MLECLGCVEENQSEDIGYIWRVCSLALAFLKTLQTLQRKELKQSKQTIFVYYRFKAQELCESRGGRPGLLSLINLRFLWTYSNTSTQLSSFISLLFEKAGYPEYLDMFCVVLLKSEFEENSSKRIQEYLCLKSTWSKLSLSNHN